MTGEYIVVIDNGTQSVRALLFDPQGNLVARGRVPIEPYFSEQPGWAEQHPDYYWRSICEACQQLWVEMAKLNIPKTALAGVTLTTQRGTVINLDAQGKPLRPAMVWLDQRMTGGQKPVGGLWALIFRAIGMTETVAYFQAEAEANWIRTHQPEIWAKTYKYLLLSGYLSYRLTGRYVDSACCQVGYVPFDYKKFTWAASNDWKWQAVPIERALLPDLVMPGESLGEVTSEAAVETGLLADLPVVAGAADKACEALGSGCITPDLACLGYGTNATLAVTSRKYVEVIPFVPPFPSAMPGAYSLDTQVYRGYWMISWFLKEFGHPEQRLADEQGSSPEVLLDKLADNVPSGSLGLILQPYWSPGVKVPGREAKGAVIGFGDTHNRAHVYRAILEGIAYSLREGLERTEKRGKLKVRELRAAGGGSQSDTAIQITADIFGLPISRPHTFETSGLGAAIDAAVGLKLHSDFSSAVSSMTRISRVFEPNAKNHAIYDALFQRVYKQMYPRLKPLYEEIRAITGYPEHIDHHP